MSRSPLLDLISLDFAFSQQALLTAEEFTKEADRRGYRLDFGELEAFHRTGALVPVFRAKRLLWSPSHPRGRQSLVEMRRRQLLIDPRNERFRTWSPYYSSGKHRDWSSRWVYSPYQLLFLDRVTRDVSLGTARLAAWRRARYPYAARSGTGEAIDPKLIAALTSLERRYLPELTQRLHLPPDPARSVGDNGTEYLAWMRAWDPVVELRRLSYPPSGLLSEAEKLLQVARWIDPLHEWLPVVRHASFDSWDKLKGAARLAIDYRVAAELLLRFYEDLAESGKAPPLPTPPPNAAHPLHDRLVRNRITLDSDLTDFGLSPHPLVILVLEGETEMILIPAAMKAAGFAASRSAVQIVNARGSTRDLAPFAAALATPEVTPFQADPEYVLLTRPATRFLIASDAEELYSSAKLAQTRMTYVRAIAKALKQLQGVTVNEQEVDSLVSIHTWGTLSIEFACFTDRQLALAINRAKGSATPPLTANDLNIARRSPNPNKKLGGLLQRHAITTKPEVARQLLPVVERRITLAAKRQTLDQWPIGALLLRLQEESRKVLLERTLLKGKL